jgi:hypothetical protein
MMAPLNAVEHVGPCFMVSRRCDGKLINQFLKETSNSRTDEWQFVREEVGSRLVVDDMCAAVGEAQLFGLRLSLLLVVFIRYQMDVPLLPPPPFGRWQIPWCAPILDVLLSRSFWSLPARHWALRPAINRVELLRKDSMTSCLPSGPL